MRNESRTFVNTGEYSSRLTTFPFSTTFITWVVGACWRVTPNTSITLKVTWRNMSRRVPVSKWHFVTSRQSIRYSSFNVGSWPFSTIVWSVLNIEMQCSAELFLLGRRGQMIPVSLLYLQSNRAAQPSSLPPNTFAAAAGHTLLNDHQ